MLPRKTPRRKCKEYEREWNGFCVDSNLEDDWLARLNSLRAFALISICEGHSGRPGEPSKVSPHIKLRLKPHLLPDISASWEQHKMAVVSEVDRLSDIGDTYVVLELKYRLRSGTGRLSYQEELLVRIHGPRARESEQMDPEIREWFQSSVSRIEQLDHFVGNLCSENGG
jgi:hypothetical protein